MNCLVSGNSDLVAAQSMSAVSRTAVPIYARRRLYSKLPMAWVPTVVENEGGNRERSFDIYSRLLRDRIVLVGRPITDVLANLIVAQLIFLAADDPEKEIQMYVNSPGGSVAAGFAIYDTMQYVSPPISTVAVGRAASFGTVLLMAGAKGRRLALPNSTIHMHQPLIGGGGLSGPASLSSESSETPTATSSSRRRRRSSTG